MRPEVVPRDKRLNGPSADAHGGRYAPNTDPALCSHLIDAWVFSPDSRSHLMTRDVQRRDPELTFRAFEAEGAWGVSRNHETFGKYETAGDAVRAACLAARTAETHGHRARVLMPQGAVVPHYEPQLGL